MRRTVKDLNEKQLTIWKKTLANFIQDVISAIIICDRSYTNTRDNRNYRLINDFIVCRKKPSRSKGE